MEEAFEEWFVELWRVSFRVAYRLRGNRADAEDLASASLSDALCAWAEIRVPAAWVATVTARKAVRTASRSVVPEGPLERPWLVEERADLLRGLRRLSRRQREVVVLRFVADLPEVAVAEQLGISVSAVKAHSARALAALRAHLEVREPSEPELRGG